ncbi:MAG: sigma-70 family RNA polymerase sigma factor [Kiritimatiellae bacterium]|nr:sigma-70 family RNA polymerase sigma factor [Kiritimatiellia bacterium]
MDLEPNTDAAVARVHAGDVDAFGLLIEAYHVRIRAILTGYVHDPAAVDDLAQQTFVFAFQHIDEYHPGTNCLAWLAAIARNKALSHLEKRTRVAGHFREYWRAQITEATARLTAGPQQEMRVQALRHCVGQLPETQRDFLRQVHGRDGTFEQLARRLGQGAGAVRMRISRLHQMLRRCIERRQAEWRRNGDEFATGTTRA